MNKQPQRSTRHNGWAIKWEKAIPRRQAQLHWLAKVQGLGGPGIQKDAKQLKTLAMGRGANCGSSVFGGYSQIAAVLQQ